jgi:hypothetical protein
MGVVLGVMVAARRARNVAIRKIKSEIHPAERVTYKPMAMIGKDATMLISIKMKFPGVGSTVANTDSGQLMATAPSTVVELATLLSSSRRR